MSEAQARSSRRTLFRVGALLSPIVVFGILELLLRIVGFGGSYPLFLDYPDVPGARSANPDWSSLRSVLLTR